MPPFRLHRVRIRRRLEYSSIRATEKAHLFASSPMAPPCLSGQRSSHETDLSSCATRRELMGPALLEDRNRPDFRDLYELHVRRAVALDAALSRIRLGGVTLGERELGGLTRIRLLVGEIRAFTVAAEAEAMAADPRRRPRLTLLLALLREERLEVRIAPLAGWSPDFSVFTGAYGSHQEQGSEGPVRILMLGPHWFDRPYPHAGPAFGVVLEGAPAERARIRFDELWAGAYDLRHPVETVLSDTLQRERA